MSDQTPETEQIEEPKQVTAIIEEQTEEVTFASLVSQLKTTTNLNK